MAQKHSRQRPLRRALFTRLGALSLGALPHEDCGLFLFFNHAVIGGADFVHLRITQALADARPTVFFTLPTDPQPLAPEFEAVAHVEALGAAVGGHSSRFFTLGRLAARINRCARPVLLGGNSRLFYELLPLLKPQARCFDLLHAIASVEHFSLPYVPRLEKRVFITAAARDEFAQLYAQAGHGEEFKQRMMLIENCVDVPPQAPSKADGPLQVLYVGRGSPEKRIHLVGRIAAECKRRGVAAEFDLVGDCEAHLDAQDRAACRFAGMLHGPQAVGPYYQRAHVLLLTSSREGFPLVVMEAMAQGAVPVCTNVGGMPAHVIDAQTGVLLPAQEEAVVAAAVEAIAALANDRPRLAALSTGAYARACEHFSAQRFTAAWRELLLPAGG